MYFVSMECLPICKLVFLTYLKKLIFDIKMEMRASFLTVILSGIFPSAYVFVSVWYSGNCCGWSVNRYFGVYNLPSPLLQGCVVALMNYQHSFRQCLGRNGATGKFCSYHPSQISEGKVSPCRPWEQTWVSALGSMRARGCFLCSWPYLREGSLLMSLRLCTAISMAALPDPGRKLACLAAAFPIM